MPTTPPASSRALNGGFTLVELLLVMALLAVVLGIALPTLSSFFKGRALDYEARRLLSLAHLAQSRAVSEGIPMQLWVDADENSYGLEEEPGWDERDSRAREFKLSPDLKIETTQTNTVSLAVQSLLNQRLLKAAENRATLSEAQKRDLPMFRFMPDGSFDPANPVSATIKDQAGRALELRLSKNRLSYEIAPGE